MSISHIIILMIMAVIVIPPEKLPEVARQAARFFNDLRRATSGMWDDIKKDAVFKPEDILKKKINETMTPKSEENKNHES